MFALLILVGFVGLHWKLIAFSALVAAAVKYGREFYEQHQADQAAERRRNADIAARADEQHAEVMRGDEHGTYGDAWTAHRKFNALHLRHPTANGLAYPKLSA